MEWRGREWRGGEGREGEGRAGQGRVPDCLGGLSRVGISSRSTRPWNGQPPSITYTDKSLIVPLYKDDMWACPAFQACITCHICIHL